MRMGIHCGEAQQTAAGLVGLEVHRAARVAAVGHGGQVLLSEAAAVLVRDALPTDAACGSGRASPEGLGPAGAVFQLHARDCKRSSRRCGRWQPVLPNNLPAQLTSFIGREKEVSEVRALVESRLVTLTGSGGCGKTRLALQVAAELLDGSGTVCGWWSWRSPTGRCGADHRRRAGRERAGGQACRPLLDSLKTQDLLIVLDNCEHLIDACAQARRRRAQKLPAGYLLASSREALGIAGETIYRVPSLSLPDPKQPQPGEPVHFEAVRCSSTGPRGRRPSRSPTAPPVASICQRLDGIPLAIELAAARMRSISLEDINGRLDQRFRLLTGGSRTALKRQQTLRATIGWSYSLLSGAEQPGRVLNRYSRHDGCPPSSVRQIGVIQHTINRLRKSRDPECRCGEVPLPPSPAV